jgi:hypothetical protein
VADRSPLASLAYGTLKRRDFMAPSDVPLLYRCCQSSPTPSQRWSRTSTGPTPTDVCLLYPRCCQCSSIQVKRGLANLTWSNGPPIACPARRKKYTACGGQCQLSSKLSRRSLLNLNNLSLDVRSIWIT